MTERKSKAVLVEENRQLRTRVEELEAVLYSIRSGEVDALVVSKPAGEQVLPLQGALEPYRIMVETMGEGAVSLSAESTILYCNARFVELVRMPRERIIGLPLHDMIAEPDRKTFDEIISRGLQELMRGELTLLASDGIRIPVQLSMCPLPESDGRAVSVVVTDLTEVFAAAQTRTLLSLIVESSDDAIVSTTLDGVVKSWNRAAEQLFGYSAGEAIGHSLNSLIVPPECSNELIQELEAIGRGKPTLFEETVRLRKDGTRFDISIKASPVFDEAGKVIGASIDSRDITQRKRVQKERDRATYLLGERLKEINCLYSVSSIVAESELSVEQRLQRIVETIPTGFQFPEVTCARITVADIQYSSADFKETAWRLACDIEKGEDNSSLEVFYTEARPASDEGPFLHEEKDLINTLGRILRDFLQLEHSLSQLTRFRELVDASNDGVFVVEPGSARLVDVNRQACDALGYSRDELLRLHVLDIDPMLPNASAWDAHVREIKKTGSLLLEGEHRRKDGSTFPAEFSLRYVSRDEDDYIIAITRDITTRKQAENRVAQLNRILAVLSGINTLIVRVNDREELFSEACNIAVSAGGFRMAMLVIVDPTTMLPASITSAGKDEKLIAEIKKTMSSSAGMQKTLVAQVIREKKVIIANDAQNDPRLLLGQQYSAAGVRSMTVMPLIKSDDAVGALALYASEMEFFHEDEINLLTELVSDIAYAMNHIDKQEQLNYLAYYDELTGLANRTLLLERVAQYMRGADSSKRKLALGLIDLERFRNINDSLGRVAGDSLLKQMAMWLTQFTQDDDLLARIDADHFAFVIPGIETDQNLARYVEKLVAAFQEHSFDLNDVMFRLSIKIGITVFPDDGDNVDILYANAEAALKKAKQSGDQYLFYNQKMTETVADTVRLENQLRGAVDNKEFLLYYQPKVNLMSGEVTSAEALIRWNDPLTGLVPPGMFIPTLEETGLISEVGRWALRQAVTDWLRWRNAGLPAMRIAVNVSPLQLRNANFLDELKEILAIDTEVASGLELEITESLIMQDIEHNITTLEAASALGISIAIDDFGTGFSSLAYLSKLPIDKLKIDRSFVIDMTTGPENLALVSTIISLAHSLKLNVIAEGVETEEQSHLLRLLDCDEMQGFLFSKPVPAEIFEAEFLAPITQDKKR